MPVWSRDAPRRRIVIDSSAICTFGGLSSRPMCGSHMLPPVLTCLMTLPAGHRSYPADSWKTWELCGCLSTSRLTFGGRLQGDPRCPAVLWRPDVLAKWSGRRDFGGDSGYGARPDLGSGAWLRNRHLRSPLTAMGCSRSLGHPVCSKRINDNYNSNCSKG